MQVIAIGGTCKRLQAAEHASYCQRQPCDLLRVLRLITSTPAHDPAVSGRVELNRCLLHVIKGKRRLMEASRGIACWGYTISGGSLRPKNHLGRHMRWPGPAGTLFDKLLSKDNTLY